MFNEHSAGAITVERSLHEGFLKDLGVPREEAEATQASPTTLAYTSFLLRTATLGDYPEVLGAVLPCYWIYREVGKALLERGSPDPRYQQWIETYGGEEFGSLADACVPFCAISSPFSRACAVCSEMARHSFSISCCNRSRQAHSLGESTSTPFTSKINRPGDL
jgi:thiaminase/transcriptional activator TenA